MNPRPEGRMRKLGWCHNGYHTLAAAEVARRARLAGLDALIIKYGDPAFEGAIATAGITWGVERFAYAHQPEREAKMLADAVDDYQVKIPMEDIRDYDVIVAYAMNGKPLPPDNKGPLWVIYPYSEHSRLQKDLYFSRSVWQLNRLTVQ